MLLFALVSFGHMVIFIGDFLIFFCQFLCIYFSCVVVLQCWHSSVWVGFLPELVDSYPNLGY